MNTPPCKPFEWTQPQSARTCTLRPDQQVVDFNLILTGLPEDIEQVIQKATGLPISDHPIECINLRDYLKDEMCAAIPSLRAFQPLQIRLYDLVGDESEAAVWQAIRQVYDHAAKEGKIVFADPNYITGDPEGGSGGSGGVQGGPEGGSGRSGSLQGVPEGGSGGSGGVQGGPDGNVGGRTASQAFMEHWAFYAAQGINLEAGHGLRINARNKGQSTEIYIFDTVDQRIDQELNRLEKVSEPADARHYVRLQRDYPPEPLEICISSPSSRFWGESKRYVQIKSEQSEHRTRMDEHGLFVAGLIHRIAPECKLHLVDSLNSKGQGELFGFLGALMLLAQRGLARAGPETPKPLQQTVINLSLGVILSAEMMAKVGVEQGLAAMRDGINREVGLQNLLMVSMLENMLSETHYVGSLRLVIKLLHGLGAYLVAAAGNDSASITGDLPSQIPARYPEVISAAASVYNGKKANYSNRGDILAPGGGSDVLDVKAYPAPHPASENVDESQFAMMSIVPKMNEEDSGYALWRGTSFAAPMVSGLLALMIEKMKRDENYLATPKIKELLANRSREGVIDVQMALDSV